MLTWRDHLLHLPAELADPLAKQCLQYLECLPRDPLGAARAALQQSSLWAEVEDSDHLTDYLARLLNPRSLRGCRDDLFLSHQAWRLASRGQRRSATVILETFGPDNGWASLARCLLAGASPTALPPLSDYRGKQRKLIEAIRRHEVDGIVATCLEKPRAFLVDFKGESIALELALAGHPQLAEPIWEKSTRYYGSFSEPGLRQLLAVHRRLGNHKQAKRLGKLLYGRGYKLTREDIPLAGPWAELDQAASQEDEFAYRSLFRGLLAGLLRRGRRRLPDLVGWESWSFQANPSSLRPVCFCAWKALHGEPWQQDLPRDPGDLLSQAAQAELLEATGHQASAAALRERLPGHPMLVIFDALEESERSRELAQDCAQETQRTRRRRQHLQTLLDAGNLAQALVQANGSEVLEIAQTLQPEDDWEALEARLSLTKDPSLRIRLLLLLGSARRAQGRTAEAQSAFAMVRKVHPDPLLCLGGDPLPPFRRPVESVIISAAVIQAMHATAPERVLLNYLLELPTSAIQLESIVDQIVSDKSMEELHGCWRSVLRALLARLADFPYSGSVTVGMLAWLYPEKIEALEGLLREPS